MFQKLKQYKDLRDQAKDVQSALADVTVHADAAGGKIAVIMDGNQKIQAIDIDAELLSPDNKDKIQDGIKTAIEAAMKKVQKEMLTKMRSGEFEMPDLSKLS